MTREKASLLAWNLLSYSGIILASLLCYWDASDIFFAADDFLWLERAKYTVPNDFLSIFKPESWTYFDTLVHLLFRANYLFNGLNPTWYHRTDFIIHSINALLVAYLAFLLTKNSTASFFSGFIFAVFHTNADSVLFISDRVDTLAAVFYLSSIISYLHYQKESRLRFYYLSIVLFALSLLAKITPVILPIVILALELTNKGQKKNTRNIFIRAFPYFILSAVYLLILSYGFPKGIVHSSPLGGLNTKEFFRGISVLFFPESVIIWKESIYIIISLSLMILTIVLGVLFIPVRSLIVTFVMISVIIGPILFLKLSFTYATPWTPPYFVLGSIYHRLYLGITGFSILVGTIVAFSLEKLKIYKVLWYVSLIVLISSIFYYNHKYVDERKDIFRAHGTQFKDYITMIEKISKKRDPLGFSDIYFIRAIGFTQPIIRIYADNSNLTVNNFHEYSDIPDIVSSPERSAVWVLKRDFELVDMTEEVRAYQWMRKTCENTSDDKARKECWEEFSKLLNRLNDLS